MIKEDAMSLEEMRKTAESHLCACGGLLTIAWGGAYKADGYILRCGKDINHSTFSRHDKRREAQIERIKEVWKMDSKSLMVMDDKLMLQRVEMARFPQQLTIQEKRLLAQVAITYGFDPLMGEVTIYQGRPFISIDGRYRKAQETGALDGVQSRPATKQERTDWEIPDGDYFFQAEVYVKDTSHPFVGWGRVKKAETVGGKGFKPVETNPQRMAEKRAEAQALRKAFHIPLPSVEEIGAEEVGTAYDIDSTARVVDEKTGEIIEQPTYTEPPPEEAPSQNAVVAPKRPTAEESKGITPAEKKEGVEKQPETFRNWGDVAARAKNRGVPTSEVFKRANVNSWSGFATYEEAWAVVEELAREKEAK